MRLLTAASALTLLVMSALAQAPIEKRAAPKAGSVIYLDVSAADRSFINAATSAGMAQVELGKLVGEKGQSAAIKEFAIHMAWDHGQANQDLMTVAIRIRAKPVEELSAEDKATLQKLNGLSGAGLDRTYMEGQVRAHLKAVQLYQHQATAGQNVELKRLAIDTLPRLQEHLQKAQQIVAETAKAAATAKKPAGGHRNAAAAQPPTAQPITPQPTTAQAAGTATAPRQRTSRAAQDAEHAKVLELNRQQLQQIEQGGGAPSRAPQPSR